MESNRLIEACRARGIAAERLFRGEGNFDYGLDDFAEQIAGQGLDALLCAREPAKSSSRSTSPHKPLCGTPRTE